MSTEWFRFWYVSPWTSEINGSTVALHTLAPQQSHLRSYVTWYIESTGIHAAAEPCAVGIWAQEQLQSDPAPTPPDIAQTPSLTGDWWQWEVHPPAQLAEQPTYTQRLLWPRDAPRTWDIKTNRRPLGDQALYVYLVWALPVDVYIHSRAVVAWSMLINTP